MLEAISDAQHLRWGSSEELLAVIAETLHALLLLTARIHTKRGTQLPPPLRVRRPHEQDRRPKLTFGQMARQMARG